MVEVVEKKEVTNLFGQTVRKAYVKYNGQNYVVSDNGKETLIFDADDSFVSDTTLEVNSAYSLEDGIENFEEYIKSRLPKYN